VESRDAGSITGAVINGSSRRTGCVQSVSMSIDTRWNIRGHLLATVGLHIDRKSDAEIGSEVAHKHGQEGLEPPLEVSYKDKLALEAGLPLDRDRA